MRATGDIGILDSGTPYDVCIVGSGFSGTVLACALAARGVRTLVLESGGSLARWLLDSRLKAMSAYSVSGDADYPTERTIARVVGGNSNFWTGRCERFHPTDFGRHPYTPPTNPWPLDYDELAPYYERAEATLAVRGDALSEHMPPRRADLPVHSRTDVKGLQRIVSKAEIQVDVSPTATPRKSLRFFRLQKELLPRFLSSPHGAMLTGASVTELMVDRDGRVTGATAKTLDGTTKIARARFYVVACGGLETPRLLLLSRSDAFPAGIGNTYDRVGRGFNEHPGVNFYSTIRHSRETIRPRHRLGRSHQTYEDFRKDGLGSVLPVFIQSWVFPNHLLKPHLDDIPRVISALVRRTIRPELYIGATIEMRPHDENRLTLSPDARDQFGNPRGHLRLDFSEDDRRTLDRARELIRGILARLGATDVREGEQTWSRHHIGTCRVGTSPATSVADATLRVHGCPNLYLSGSETFVTGSALPPVLTIVALGHRLSEHMIERLRNG